MRRGSEINESQSIVITLRTKLYYFHKMERLLHVELDRTVTYVIFELNFLFILKRFDQFIWVE